MSQRNCKKAIIRFTHANTTRDLHVETRAKDDPALRRLLTPKTLRKLEEQLQESSNTPIHHLTFTYHTKTSNNRLSLAIFSNATYRPYTNTVHQVRNMLLTTSPITVHFLKLGETDITRRIYDIQNSFQEQRIDNPLIK
jgi:hypothetical protein